MTVTCDASLGRRFEVGFTRMLMQLAAAVRREIDAQNAARVLAELADADLADIGIRRCEIERVVRNGARPSR